MERRAGIGSYASWVALAVAFSPVLQDLGRNAVQHPEDRVILVAPLLLLLALRGESTRAPTARRDGALAIALGVGLEWIGLATEASSIARLGLPIAALGLARFTGRPAVATAALLFFAIPVPDSLVLLVSPALQSATVEALGALLRHAGASVQSDGLAWIGPGKRIVLDPAEGAATLALALGALGWYSALRARKGVASAALRTAWLASLAAPLQIAVLLVTGALLAADRGSLASFWLRQGSWIAVALVGLLLVERGAARAPLRASGRPSRLAFGG